MKEIADPHWVEIVDPKTHQRMFANLTTGQVNWCLPDDVSVKKADDNQWWELYDQNSSRYYYYMPKSMETTWQKPTNCDIIPLAKLQHLKENTEVTSGGRVGKDTLTRANSRQRPRSPPSFDEGFYSNFTRDLSSQLNDVPAHHHSISTIPSSSGSLRLFDENGTQTEFSTRKQRFPSASSARSRNSSTRSKFDSCLQEMLVSQNATAIESTTPATNRFNDFRRLEHSYSTSSSVSSGGQSADLLSQVTIESSTGQLKTSTTTSNNTIATSNRSPQSNLPKTLVWSKEPLKTSISSFTDKKLKKRAASTIKRIMEYMGDRKVKSKNSIDQLVMTLLEDGGNNNELTDEIFLQILKQLTENPRPESVRKGWELLGIILFFFVPATSEVQNEVIKFVESCSDPLLDSPEFSTSRYAKHCFKRLQLPINCFKPSTANVQQARYNIFYPSMFGTSLEELMDLQRDHYPTHKVPWIETTLISMILENGGETTEGLFRIPADPDQMHTSMVQLNVWVKPAVKDAHVPAALLKQWLRQQPSPIIPPNLYDKCLASVSTPDYCSQLVNQLPLINRLVLSTLVSLLQRLCDPEIVKETKMDVSNLAMVIAPNILRCESSDPSVIFADSRRQMEFVKSLILNYDLSLLRSFE